MNTLQNQDKFSLEGSLEIARYYVKIINSYESSGMDIKGEPITEVLRNLQPEALELKTDSGKSLLEYI